MHAAESMHIGLNSLTRKPTTQHLLSFRVALLQAVACRLDKGARKHYQHPIRQSAEMLVPIKPRVTFRGVV